jgi:hypothetical protein
MFSGSQASNMPPSAKAVDAEMSAAQPIANNDFFILLPCLWSFFPIDLIVWLKDNIFL